MGDEGGKRSHCSCFTKRPLAKGQWCHELGKVTADPASHLSTVTDSAHGYCICMANARLKYQSFTFMYCWLRCKPKTTASGIFQDSFFLLLISVPSWKKPLQCILSLSLVNRRFTALYMLARREHIESRKRKLKTKFRVHKM